MTMDRDNLRLDTIIATATARQINIAVKGNAVQPDRYVELTPGDALRLGEWLVERAKARGAADQTIQGRKTGF
jgi:hypothetical protein